MNKKSLRRVLASPKRAVGQGHFPRTVRVRCGIKVKTQTLNPDDGEFES